MNLKEAVKKIASLERQINDMEDESYFNEPEIVIGDITIRDDDYAISFGRKESIYSFQIGKKFDWDRLFYWINYRKHLRKTIHKSNFVSEAQDENA